MHVIKKILTGIFKNKDEAQPVSQVWRPRTEKRRFTIWFKISGIAASLLVGLLLVKNNMRAQTCNKDRKPIKS
jgi:hypothetical protein